MFRDDIVHILPMVTSRAFTKGDWLGGLSTRSWYLPTLNDIPSYRGANIQEVFKSTDTL